MQNVLTLSLTDWVVEAMQAWVVSDDPDALSKTLRRDRRALFLRCAIRDLNGLADLSEVVLAWSIFAEGAVQSAARCAEQSIYFRYGVPRNEYNQEPLKLIPVGMGKLGGRELNVSSDVDLVLCYEETGVTDGPLSIENREFFSYVAKLIFRILDNRDQDGFVFRVDTRLRPDGVSGPQTISLPALEEYLLVRGRPWERHAWLKARAFGKENDALVRSLVEPFVFSRYLDFGAMASLRELHHRMQRDDSRRNRARDIKIGLGGIREIEFTVQLFQLIRGGQDPALRSRSTRSALQALGERGILGKEIIQELQEAYVFLRRLEHRIQYLDDAQTHRLPLPGPDLDFLALNMGFSNGTELETAVTQIRLRVTECFANSMGPFPKEKISVQSEVSAGPSSLVEDIWLSLNVDDQTTLQEGLNALAGHEGISAQPFLAGLLKGRAWRTISERGRERLGRLVQNALVLSSERPNFLKTLRGILEVLNAIGGRETYFALLDEFPNALQRLADLCAASSWLAALLAQFPSLLDELIQLHSLPDQVGPEDIQLELNRTVIPYRNDPESHMQNLRKLKQRFQFRLAILEMKQLITLQDLSDRLSHLADACIAEALLMVAGSPDGVRGFAVIAFGKLGGKEMGYRSDLDLVFVYDSGIVSGEAAARLAKKLITGLTSRSGTSELYEIDVRLRPDGASGFLVTSFDAMQDYQIHRAKTWEHQALTRARACAGDLVVGMKFEQLRLAILILPRNTEHLALEITSMRKRMHKEHDLKIKGWDIKLSEGGLVDIEFMVQFLVLAYSKDFNGLLNNIGNIALLRYAGSTHLVPPDLCESVAQAYLNLRALQHRLELQGESRDSLPRESAEPSPSNVLRLWQTVFTI